MVGRETKAECRTEVGQGMACLFPQGAAGMTLYASEHLANRRRAEPGSAGDQTHLRDWRVVWGRMC